MPWATLRKIFFCCQESDDFPLDESSQHLIPSESVESPMIYSNVVVPDHRQLKERMGLIVRTKEGKMVNVASHIPFNLHNTVLPSRSYGSVSRSTSGSLDQHSRDHNYQIDYSKHGFGHRNFQASGFNDRSRSASPSSGPTVGPSSHRKCLSRTSTTPILNVRLVGYRDNMTKPRGRTLSRSTDIRNITRIEGEGVTTTTTNAETCEGLTAASAFKLRDVGSITLSWND